MLAWRSVTQQLPDSSASPAPDTRGDAAEVSLAWAAVALGAWALLTFGHGVGLQVASALFAWSRQPNTLTRQGGVGGQELLERLLAGVFAGVALSVVSGLAWSLRAVDRRRLAAAAVPWAVWAAAVYAIWTVYIVFATELVHFAQYALIGAIVAWALGRGRRPVAAFLITFGLGFADEVWQHYGLHVWQMEDHDHWMDWSDPVLDAAGACGGILPFVTAARLRGVEVPDATRLLRRTALICAALLLPLLLLDRATLAALLGSYRYDPWWQEFNNFKPVRWPPPHEGIPLCLSAMIVFGSLLEVRRRGLPLPELLGLAILGLIAIDPPSRLRGMPVHEVVPTARALKLAAPIVVDGHLDEPAWGEAERLGPFVHSRDGRSALRLPDGSEEPLRGTWARIAWDERGLYVGFECEDPDVWARETGRDDPDLPGDEVVEVFLDDGGDEQIYVEVELSPAGAIYDLLVIRPRAPVDYAPGAPFLPYPQWSAHEIEAAVAVDGALDLVATKGGGARADADPDDRGWSAELAIPWSAFRTATTPSRATIRKPKAQPGDRWRVNFYRVERPRPRVAELGAPGERVPAAEALRLLGARADQAGELLEGPLAPDADGAVSRAEAARRGAAGRAQLQAWTPTHQRSFHYPRRFGVLELVDPAGEGAGD